MFAIVTMQALHVYTDLDDRTRLKNAVHVWIPLKLDGYGSNTLIQTYAEEESTANYQQQAWCEPNMASMKNKGSLAW